MLFYRQFLVSSQRQVLGLPALVIRIPCALAGTDFRLQAGPQSGAGRFGCLLFLFDLILCPFSIGSLHSSAAQWYEQNGYIEDSIKHWMGIERYDQAARVVIDSSPGILSRSQFYVEGETLEEMAEKMGVPVDMFTATVERYNGLVEKGMYDDFEKDPQMLMAIVKGPFVAAKVGAAILVTLDGLKINTDMQVLDAEGASILGLFTAGNSSGDFISNDYPITLQGLSHGRALTFGWLAGENAAKL